MKIVLSPDHFYNCPICFKPCEMEELAKFNRHLNLNTRTQTYLCFNPTPNNPLHYYSHIVDMNKPNRIAFHEFSMTVGSKMVLFSCNYHLQKSYLKFSKEATLLEIPYLFIIDFPNFISLTKKIQTYLTFS